MKSRNLLNDNEFEHSTRKSLYHLIILTRLVESKNVTDLLKTYGSKNESLLMTLCCQKNDSSSLRAQVFAFIARILAEKNQEAIKMIIRKDQAGQSALDYATMANNAKIAAFLAKIFYIFGQDLLCKDSQVPNYLVFDLRDTLIGLIIIGKYHTAHDGKKR